MSVVGQYEYGIALLTLEAGETSERPRLRDYDIDSQEAAEIEGKIEAAISNAAEGLIPTGPPPTHPNVPPERANLLRGEIDRLIFKAANRRNTTKEVQK